NTLPGESYFSTLHTGISLPAALTIPAPVSVLKIGFSIDLESHIIGIFFTVKIFFPIDKSHLSFAVDTQRMPVPNSHITMLANSNTAYLLGNAKLFSRIVSNHLQRILFGGPAVMHRFGGLVIQVANQFTAVRINAVGNFVSVQDRSIEGGGIIHFKLIS